MNHRSIEITQFELLGSGGRAAPASSRGRRSVRNSAGAKDVPTIKAREFGAKFSAGSGVEVLASQD